MTKLSQIRNQRFQNHQETIILVVGTPSDSAVRRLAAHIRDEITPADNDAEWMMDNLTKRIPAAYTDATAGDTVVMNVGRVLEANPPVAQVLAQTLSTGRHRLVDTIIISDKPGERLRRLANFEVTPRVVGDVEAVQPSKEDPAEQEREELKQISIEPTGTLKAK